MQDLAAALALSPALFPHSLDLPGDRIAFIELNRAQYDEASFLDARILTPRTPGRTVPWAQAAAAIESAGLVERCNYIFHIGHVGSTLVSRLLGSHARAFALREPLLLRSFAQLREQAVLGRPVWDAARYQARLEAALKMLSRSFAPGETTLVKATSFVSELADELLARPAAPRALLMYVAPESYLATILGGPNSRQEARLLMPTRLARLDRRAGTAICPPETLSEGEAIALGWACETAGLARAAAAAPERTLRLDFEQFLADPASHLSAAFSRFGMHASAAELRTILSGPHLLRYSKAPEYAYDAALRREVLNEARADHGVEIRRGLAWLEHAADRHAPVREALQFACA